MLCPLGGAATSGAERVGGAKLDRVRAGGAERNTSGLFVGQVTGVGGAGGKRLRP